MARPRLKHHKVRRSDRTEPSSVSTVERVSDETLRLLTMLRGSRVQRRQALAWISDGTSS